MDKDTLEKVAIWAEQKVNAGQEPPWSEESLESLANIARNLARGMATTVTLQDSLQLAEHQENARPQSENIFQLDNA